MYKNLDVCSFVNTYMFDPCSGELSPQDQKTALMATVLVAFFTLGSLHFFVWSLNKCAACWGNRKVKVLKANTEKVVQKIETEKVEQIVKELFPKEESPVKTIQIETVNQKKILDIHSLETAFDDDAKIDLSGALKRMPEHLRDIYPDIRKSQWMSTFHFGVYSEYLSKQFPNLQYSPCDYTIGESLNIGSTIFHDNSRSKTKIQAYNLHISGNHWGLIYVDPKARTIEYYDSKENYGNHEEIVTYFTDLVKELSLKDPGQKDYEFICKIKEKLQPDGYQCGPWVLFFLEHRLQDPNIDFNQLDLKKAQTMIANYRLKIQKVILDKALHNP